MNWLDIQQYLFEPISISSIQSSKIRKDIYLIGIDSTETRKSSADERLKVVLEANNCKTL